MALSPQEELELLQLEEEEAQTGGQPQAPAPTESKGRQFTRKVAGALPFVGGVAGEAMAGPAGPLGAALGAGAGTAYKQLITRGLEAKSPGQFFTDPTIGPSAGEAAGEIAKNAAIAGLTSGAFRGVGKAFKVGKKLISAPTVEEAILLGKEKLAGQAARGVEETIAARKAADVAKEALVGAEKQTGHHYATSEGFEDLIKNQKEMGRFIVNKFSQIEGRTAQELAQVGDSQSWQSIRKIAQEGIKKSKLSDIAQSQLHSIQAKATEVLGILEPEIGSTLKGFHAANKAVETLPGTLRNAANKQRLVNEGVVVAAKGAARTKKLIKAGLATGATYLGIKKILGH